ncbi:hypothetical protein A3A84_02475 [Candidatus Collierbacteria bacterium RIFCSPLOWO2_01_FULL_50_23]|uniref:Bacterial Ig domain-containing protein n=2 Tax=Candidatus Collieribacteriota TaxID=1752725 RepID=A0A1F5ETJ0_9BACT|nr:MAG: hypothetical protein A3D09_00935 [Candidatus Collierbacteria bacterium RIFCSPHIGHO2_02_FULL_49_10]OGD72255.1 MAG: hypothetical protein A2703_02725 [Candidatus Collierbacteria bacterium RIFCSPHIGHO2_01_FULL_50_25]OGD73822.1 MAG: hypothetical protein A3A84_02475 [Candidatus Collierbacteria bacterium RIFCSPLOWO2_01_FULL_50_23]
MRKEVIFAIIVGLVLGLVILYGIQVANKSAKQAALVLAPTPEETVTQVPTPTPVSGLTIVSPADHSVINTSIVKIIGKTDPNSTVAVYSSEDDALVSADKDGNFSFDLKLTGGENVIKVTALKPDQSIQGTQITVIYTTAKIN